MPAANEPNFKQQINFYFLNQQQMFQMSKKSKAFWFQISSFAVFFLGWTYLLKQFLPWSDGYIKILAFVVGTLLAPKFLAVTNKDGEKLYVKWIFSKQLYEIK